MKKYILKDDFRYFVLNEKEVEIIKQMLSQNNIEFKQIDEFKISIKTDVNIDEIVYNDENKKIKTTIIEIEDKFPERTKMKKKISENMMDIIAEKMFS